MAWMVNNNRVAMLSDASDASESGLIDRWGSAAGVWESLMGARAGLIGSVSEWLVASDVSDVTFRRQFGVELVTIPWAGITDFSMEEPDRSLLNRFAGQELAGLDEAARVLTLLRRVITDNNLRAVGVECFSLVQKRRVTACLALAQLNTEGTVAACEGDLASMAGMMTGKAATGIVPWMANTTRLTEKSVILSHCTAPFDMVSKVKLPTHYETGYSIAVDGDITAEEVTVYRLSEKLDRVFITEGRVISRPNLVDACRTQVEIGLPVEALKILREKPLGNHLLMLPGNHSDLLSMVCLYRGIKVVD
jgi:L-fucose isomerase-like protein